MIYINKHLVFSIQISNLKLYFTQQTKIKMIDTDTFIEQMLIKAVPEIDDEGLDMMIEDTKPVLYDRVMTHIIEKIDEKDGQWFLETIETKGVTPEVTEYLKSKIKNFPKFLEKIYDDFETMYLKEFKNFEKEFKDEDLIDSDEEETENEE